MILIILALVYGLGYLATKLIFKKSEKTLLISLIISPVFWLTWTFIYLSLFEKYFTLNDGLLYSFYFLLPWPYIVALISTGVLIYKKREDRKKKLQADKN